MRQPDSVVTEEMIRLLGQRLTLVKGGERKEIYGVIEPIRYKSKLYFDGAVNELGFDGSKRSLLITMPDVPLDECEKNVDYIELDRKRYYINHSELIYFRGRAAYRWTIVHVKR